MSEDLYDKISERYAEGLRKSMEDCAEGFKIMADNAKRLIDEQAEERMSEGPKRVWMRVNMAPKRLMEEKLFDDDIEYIRADIVEEMREALKKSAEVFWFYTAYHENRDAYDKAERNRQYAEQMEAALKLLEED